MLDLLWISLLWGATLLMIVVGVTTLTFQLYKWRTPEANDPDRYGEPDTPQLPGVIMLAARFEDKVIGATLDQMVRLDHPDYLVMVIIDHPDDPETLAIVRAKVQRYPGRIMVVEYPDTAIHNKPIGLNAALRVLQELNHPWQWVGIADAEDLFHRDLLRLVDYRFRQTGAAVVQAGVQLMDFENSWWRAANVLEYYKWFQSRLKFQARIGVMPLGGNTVFFRRSFLEAIGGWDETCLTEDCKIGIQASARGEKIDVVYIEAMVTREETPPTLRAFVRQRVRWMQGFIQVFSERQWMQLPTATQRVMAIYILGFQFFQAFTGVVAPILVAFALTQKAPMVLALLTTVPLGISILNIMIDIIMLRQFGRSFGSKVRLRDYAGLVWGAYPFQVVLALAAVRACARHLSGRTNWVKTEHAGAHMTAAQMAPEQPVPVGAAYAGPIPAPLTSAADETVEIDLRTITLDPPPHRAPDDAARVLDLFTTSERSR